MLFSLQTCVHVRLEDKQLWSLLFLFGFFLRSFVGGFTLEVSEAKDTCCQRPVKGFVILCARRCVN